MMLGNVHHDLHRRFVGARRDMPSNQSTIGAIWLFGTLSVCAIIIPCIQFNFKSFEVRGDDFTAQVNPYLSRYAYEPNRAVALYINTITVTV
jgi:hypothetical protein